MEGILTPAALAEYLGVSEKTLTHWRYVGKGPRALAIGKHRRYKASDVESWLSDQYVTP